MTCVALKKEPVCQVPPCPRAHFFIHGVIQRAQEIPSALGIQHCSLRSPDLPLP